MQMRDFKNNTIAELEAAGFRVDVTYYSSWDKPETEETPPKTEFTPKTEKTKVAKAVRTEAKEAKDQMEEALEVPTTPEPKPKSTPKKTKPKTDLMPQIRTAMVKATKVLGRDKLVSLLDVFGAKRVSDLKKADYEAFLTSLTEALGDE